MITDVVAQFGLFIMIGTVRYGGMCCDDLATINDWHLHLNQLYYLYLSSENLSDLDVCEKTLLPYKNLVITGREVID